MIYLKRYILSLWGLLLVMYFYLKTRNSTKVQLKKKYRRIVIICPGPSAIKIAEEKFSDDDMIIFINHAIKLVGFLDKNNFACISDNLFYFSQDTPRTYEAYNLHPKEMSKVKVFFLPYHYMHIPYFNYLSNINFLLNPKFRFSWEYGFELNNNSTDGFKRISMGRNSACGFGTLVTSLQLALAMGEKKIVLYGCDFGVSKDKRYFDEAIPVRLDTPFDKIRTDFFEVKNILQNLQWSVEIK